MAHSAQPLLLLRFRRLAREKLSYGQAVREFGGTACGKAPGAPGLQVDTIEEQQAEQHAKKEKDPRQPILTRKAYCGRGALYGREENGESESTFEYACPATILPGQHLALGLVEKLRPLRT